MPSEETWTKRGHDVVVQVIESVRPTFQRLPAQELLKPERFRGCKEGEQRSLILGELPKESTKNKGGKGVQGVAGAQALLQLSCAHRSSPDPEGDDSLNQKFSLFVECLEFSV